MSSFIRSAICGSSLEISTGLILQKNIYLTPMPEFQMCLLWLHIFKTGLCSIDWSSFMRRQRKSEPNGRRERAWFRKYGRSIAGDVESPSLLPLLLLLPPPPPSPLCCCCCCCCCCYCYYCCCCYCCCCCFYCCCCSCCSCCSCSFCCLLLPLLLLKAAAVAATAAAAAIACI